MTDISILKSLNLEIGSLITLLELDDRVERLIDNEDIDTPLQAFSSDEIISWGEYKFYTEEDNEIFFKINFEVVENTGDENTIIRIIK